MVKLTSIGPIFYKSERIGYHGFKFKLIKFRSLELNAPEIVNDDFKTIVQKHDPRLTPIGSILRIGFDELPQLLNIIRGDMTLIGPRPDNDWMLNRYDEVLSIRLKMLPGITGLGVVCNGRDLTTIENYILDIWYVQNHSLWIDFLIAIMTPLYMFGWKNIGSYLRQKILTEYSNLLNENITASPSDKVQ